MKHRYPRKPKFCKSDYDWLHWKIDQWYEFYKFRIRAIKSPEDKLDHFRYAKERLKKMLYDSHTHVSDDD